MRALAALVLLGACTQRPPAPPAPPTPSADASSKGPVPEVGPLVALGRVADRAAASSGPPGPDGDPDVVFGVRVSGPVAAFAISDSDVGGKVVGNAVWSTLLGDAPVGKLFSVPRVLGKDTWTIAVVRNGALQNPEGPLPKGTVYDRADLVLHIADPGGGFANGHTVVLLVLRPDGTVDRSAGAIL